jgi:hypothetical protein
MILATSLSYVCYTDALAVEDQDSRWNSSYDMIERAVMLRTAIDEFMRKIIKEYDDYIAKITHDGSKALPKRHQPRPAICGDYLCYDLRLL